MQYFEIHPDPESGSAFRRFSFKNRRRYSPFRFPSPCFQLNRAKEIPSEIIIRIRKDELEPRRERSMGAVGRTHLSDQVGLVMLNGTEPCVFPLQQAAKRAWHEGRMASAERATDPKPGTERHGRRTTSDGP
jgi:hypothetical protein